MMPNNYSRMCAIWLRSKKPKWERKNAIKKIDIITMFKFNVKTPFIVLSGLVILGLTQISCSSEAEKYVDEISIVQEKLDRKSTRLNSSHVRISYAVFCLKKKNYDLSSF